MLFGATKPMVAARRRRPEFLSFDAGITPPVHFFILLDYFGRNRLNELLKNPVSPPRPCRNWDGGERRRRSGSPEDRLHEPLDSRLLRMGDREILLEDVKRGRLFVSPQ
jgi:hypothetical protein